MPPLLCPRCQRTNPDAAGFCYFDGAELRSQQDGSFHRLAKEFVFPSGRRCRTFDEFVETCRDEWPAARELLQQGIFKQFFGGSGRTDLAQVAHELMEQYDGDIALTRFLDALPAAQTQTPKIDINPRRLLLGNLLAGEQRQLELIVSNQGQGTLQGTLTVSEGGDWLKIAGAEPGQSAIATAREQKFPLVVDTRGLPAGGAFKAKLTVITNGGVVEVQARMELLAQPYNKQPFQGAKTPREMAERMRKLPKAAGPALESGEVSRWFTSNGWNFPIRGAQAKGVAGVQQFFETMGLSKPPPVHMAPAEVRLGCLYPEVVRSQVALQTAAKKWVYAVVASDSPWLRVLTPQVSGPQQAVIAFEIDPGNSNTALLKGTLQITANGGKVLAVNVIAEVRGGPRPRLELPRAALSQACPSLAAAPGAGRGKLVRPVLTMALAFLLVRLALVPIVDLTGCPAAVKAAAAKLNVPVSRDSPLSTAGGWLRLPWTRLLLGTDRTLPADSFNPLSTGAVPAAEFRHYYASYLLRWLILWTWWLGALWGGVTVMGHGGPGSLPWGVLAGAVAGLAASATFGSFFLVVDILPHVLWGWLFSGLGGGWGPLFLWVSLALGAWTCCGAAAGVALGWAAPLQNGLVSPVQKGLCELCRLCGLRRLGRAFGA